MKRLLIAFYNLCGDAYPTLAGLIVMNVGGGSVLLWLAAHFLPGKTPPLLNRLLLNLAVLVCLCLGYFLIVTLPKWGRDARLTVKLPFLAQLPPHYRQEYHLDVLVELFEVLEREEVNLPRLLKSEEDRKLFIDGLERLITFAKEERLIASKNSDHKEQVRMENFIQHAENQRGKVTAWKGQTSQREPHELQALNGQYVIQSTDDKKSRIVFTLASGEYVAELYDYREKKRDAESFTVDRDGGAYVLKLNDRGFSEHTEITLIHTESGAREEIALW